MMGPQPYIGITDFTKPEEVRAMQEVLLAHPGRNGRLLMVGVMMSHKTMNGIPSKWSDVFPKKEDIQKIFIGGAGLLNTIHYADYSTVGKKEDLTRAAAFGGTHLHAMQLDMIWPTPAAVEALKGTYPTLKIVLQVGRTALKELRADKLRDFARRIGRYGENIDYVLLDWSMGRGLGMGTKTLMPFAEELVRRYPKLGLVVAGGLGPETVALAIPMLRHFPRTSLDAQGKLRPSGNAKDPVDWGLAKRYLNRGLSLCAACAS